MQPAYPVTAQVLAQRRLDNALSLFEEFVRATARHADAATLRGLEGRFAERVLIQPSYWSQIKSRSRQIGERLARQFEQRCNKPAGWMDLDHRATAAAVSAANAAANAEVEDPPSLPRDDDERFMVGLVLSYYRRHPQRAKARLLELLGEVLTPTPSSPPSTSTARTAAPGPTAADDAHDVWLRSQRGVAPLRPKKR
jgi:hypothetical protein